MVNKFIYLFR